MAVNLQQSGAAGVMSAEGLLQNPLLFETEGAPTARELAEVALEVRAAVVAVVAVVREQAGSSGAPVGASGTIRREVATQQPP